MKLAQRLALVTCLLTIALIGIGAYVRATGSGLGCPDWPTCHGGVVPPNSRHSVIEFAHRFTASIVGLLVIATAVTAWRYYRHVPIAIWAATIAVPLVGIQGVLGAITVMRELPPEIVATHLLTAMLVLTVQATAYFAMHLEDPANRGRLQAIVTAPSRLPGTIAIVAILWLAALMWIGGYMAESGASAACSGWPLCNGSVLPGNQHQEIAHMIHRYLAALFVGIAIPLLVVTWRSRQELFWAGAVSIALVIAFSAQVMIGAFNVWYAFPDLITVAHTVVASLVWLTVTTAIVLTFYVPATERRTQPLTRAKASA